MKRPEDEERAEIVEIDERRWVNLTFARVWPKYVVTWSLRQRAGDGDFPLGNGSVDSLPPRQGDDLDALGEQLRQKALDQAHGQLQTAPTAVKRRSLIDRVLGRR